MVCTCHFYCTVHLDGSVSAWMLLSGSRLDNEVFTVWKSSGTSVCLSVCLSVRPSVCLSVFRLLYLTVCVVRLGNSWPGSRCGICVLCTFMFSCDTSVLFQQRIFVLKEARAYFDALRAKYGPDTGEKGRELCVCYFKAKDRQTDRQTEM